MKDYEIKIPDILLTTARSHRSIRARLIHTPHKNELEPEEANLILNNTQALINILFKNEKLIVIPKFVEKIKNYTKIDCLREFLNFEFKIKKEIYRYIFDKLFLLEYEDFKGNEILLDFIIDSLENELNLNIKIVLFEIFFKRVFIEHFPFYKWKFIEKLEQLSNLEFIQDIIKEKNLINHILNEFEQSYSFEIASKWSEIVLNISHLLDDSQINKVVETSIKNNQIYDSWGAQKNLDKFLDAYKERIKKDKYWKLKEKI